MRETDWGLSVFLMLLLEEEMVALGWGSGGDGERKVGMGECTGVISIPICLHIQDI